MSQLCCGPARRPFGTGRNGCGPIWPGACGAGGVGTSRSASGAEPRRYAPIAAVVPGRNAGPPRCAVSPNNHRLSVSDQAALRPASREIGAAAVSASDTGRPRSTVAAVASPAVRRLRVALRSPGSGRTPGAVTGSPGCPPHTPGVATSPST